MEPATLDEFKAWNEQLAALIAAGVPLDLGLSRSNVSAPKALEQITTVVARRMHRGETLEQALEGDEQEVPAAYRSIIQFALRTGNLSEALDGSTRLAETRDDSRVAIRRAMFYPLVVCTLAYLGLIGFCLFLVPTLEDTYLDAELTPGPALRAMQMLRDLLSYWIAIPPILFMVLRWWMRNAARQATAGNKWGAALLPGVSRTMFQQRCARFADWLAELIDSQVPLDEALLIAGGSSGDAELREGATELAAAAKAGQFPRDDSPVALRFPPFLRWAIWHDDTPTGRARVLRIASQMFQSAAERRTYRMQIFAPMIVLVLLGGTVTLLYGLALFMPVVEMLYALAM